VKWNRCPRCKCDIVEADCKRNIAHIFVAAPQEKEEKTAPKFSWFSEKMEDEEPPGSKLRPKFEQMPEPYTYIFNTISTTSVWKSQWDYHPGSVCRHIHDCAYSSCASPLTENFVELPQNPGYHRQK
jgi:hypothetical protein